MSGLPEIFLPAPETICFFDL